MNSNEGRFLLPRVSPKRTVFPALFAIKIEQKSQNLLSRTVRAPREAGMEKGSNKHEEMSRFGICYCTHSFML